MIEKSESESVSRTNGSGFGRPKNMRIGSATLAKTYGFVSECAWDLAEFGRNLAKLSRAFVDLSMPSRNSPAFSAVDPDRYSDSIFISQCCGSGFFPSLIPDPGSKRFPDPGSTSASKNLNILTQNIVSKLSEIWSGMFIPDPGVKGTGFLIRHNLNRQIMQYRYYFNCFDKSACLIEHVLPRHVEEKAGQRHLNTVLQTLAKIFRPTFHGKIRRLAKKIRLRKHS